MIVGIDVHKRAHVAALLDERGGELGTLDFANSPEGMRRLRSWLVAHDAGEAVVGVESPAGYGRLLVASLETAGHQVLNVPAWRTHRERGRHGPGKTDPGDAIAVAQVVLRKRAELGPALEPELVRALRSAWAEPEYGRALASLEALALKLETSHPGAAASLREGLEETLTLTRLGVTGQLKATLASTNPVESMIEIVRQTQRNVKRWRSGEMALRWTAAGMLEAERQFRRVVGYRDLPKLLAAIEREQHTDEEAPMIDAA